MSDAKRTLLIVEDDPGLQSQLRWSLDGYNVLLATDREGALAHLRRSEPPVLTLDLGLPPDADGTSEGFATLEQILALAPETKV
ncbi:MAG TPA: response regulator, partial [Pseudodesulfovibrio sp.]|nr:response regulator [Pseudodesulfovibrio sp.]